MLNCKQVTKLVSESFARKLSIRERLNLWIHTGMCSTCRTFRQFQTRLHHTIHGKMVDDDADSKNQLSETARRQIGDVIESRLKND